MSGLLKTQSRDSISSRNSRRRVSAGHFDNEMLADSEFADVQFTVAGTNILGHRAVIASRSKVMRNMFKASKGSPGDRYLKIDIPAVHASVFKTFLKYIYTQKVDFTWENAIPMLELANRYEVAHLPELVSDWLDDRVNIENCCDLLLDTKKFEACRTVQSTCWNTIITDFEAVWETFGFMKLDHKTVIKLLQDDGLAIKYERIALYALVRWVRNDANTRVPRLMDMLPLIRWAFLPSDILLRIIAEDGKIDATSSLPLDGGGAVITPDGAKPRRRNSKDGVGVSPQRLSEIRALLHTLVATALEHKLIRFGAEGVDGKRVTAIPRATYANYCHCQRVQELRCDWCGESLNAKHCSGGRYRLNVKKDGDYASAPHKGPHCLQCGLLLRDKAGSESKKGKK